MPADPTAQEVVGPTGPAWESSDRRSPDEERLGARLDPGAPVVVRPIADIRPVPSHFRLETRTSLLKKGSRLELTAESVIPNQMMRFKINKFQTNEQNVMN